MGVPGFYRWAVRKVKTARKDADGSKPHEFDNVYLDFNGVVHGCIDGWAGKEDLDVLFQRIEEQLWILVSVVRPLALLYIALDGVAPRAKMNQQRSRRFRAAKEADETADTLEGAGRGSFDRNAVTPGTAFMERLGDFLEAWADRAAAKMQGVTIVISGDRDPGEGEHKIMEIIRHHPDRSHVLFSNDADLIFLGLVSPADSVHLLRVKPPQWRGLGRNGAQAVQSKTPAAETAAAAAEKESGKRAAAGSDAADSVSEAPAASDVAEASGAASEAHASEEFAPPARAANGAAAANGKSAEPEPPAADGAAEDYELIDIVAIREWLGSQFPGHDPRRLGVDFMAICCLAGNDFLPHMVAVDIYDGGLDRLLKAYAKVLEAEGHLIGEDLSLQLPQWRTLLRYFAHTEAEVLLEAAHLGLGAPRKPYKGPGPPTEEWDGLSVQVSRAPFKAKADDVKHAMSKAGCVVTGVYQLQASRSDRCWLVRFAEPHMAVKSLAATRRLWNTPLSVQWVDPSQCKLVKECEETFEGADWAGALEEAVLETAEFWFSEGNLQNDAFMRRNIRAREDRFVPVEVLTRFNRLKIWCQDIDRIAKVLRRSEKLEVQGEGAAVMVRARTDYSRLPDETAEDVARQHRAVACVEKEDYQGAASELKALYYKANMGPAAQDAPPQDDVDGTERYRCLAFLVGIQWVVHYYMRGCSSWSWYYPAAYPPLCTGMKSHAEDPLVLPPLHEPFPPSLQLLAVLPPQSAVLLPEPLRPLLTDRNSSLAEFYPRDFKIDYKAGDKEWQGTVLLPFVDEQRLRAAAAELLPSAVASSESSRHPARAFLREGLGDSNGGGTKAWEFKAQDSLPVGRERLTAL